MLHWVCDIFYIHRGLMIPPNNLYVWLKNKCTKENNQAIALMERGTPLAFVGLSGFRVPSGVPLCRGLLNSCSPPSFLAPLRDLITTTNWRSNVGGMHRALSFIFSKLTFVMSICKSKTEWYFITHLLPPFSSSK